jgi:cytochrome c oxidase assembly protein subunit 15
LAISLAQGLLGYTQYFTGLPEILVGLHMLGACLVWLFTLRLVFALSTRDGDAGDEPANDPAAALAA